MVSPSVVLCLDISWSMGSGSGANNYLPAAQTAAGTFVYIMQPNDSLGVTSFSDSAYVNFPSGGSAVQALSGISDQDTAKNAITALNVMNNTNFVSGLSTSANMLTNAASPKAIVFLSDGEWNVGGSPFNSLPSVPVYTIGLGPGGNLTDLQRIASQTGGAWHAAPTLADLQDVYNQIIGQAQIATVAASQKQSVAQYRFWSLPGTIAPGSPFATFAVTWTDPSIVYTPGTPTGNQVNVTLRDPTGATQQISAYASGGGFVVFKVPTPAPGTWLAVIWSAASATLSASGGIFDLAISAAELAVDVPDLVAVGERTSLQTAIRTKEGEPIRSARVEAALESPAAPAEELFARHRERLDAIPCGNQKEEGSDNQRFLALQSQGGASADIYPYRHVPLDLKCAADGEMATDLVLDTEGAHILRVRAVGETPRGDPFSLTRRISLLARRRP